MDIFTWFIMQKTGLDETEAEKLNDQIYIEALKELKIID